MTFASHSNAAIKYRTRRESVRFTLEWAIEKFETFRNQTERMYGPGITMAELGMKDDYEGRWCIRVRPCFQRIENGIEKKFLSVYLILSDMESESDGYSDGRTVPVEFSTRVTTGKANGLEILSNTPKSRTFSSAADNWGWNDAVSHDDLFGSHSKPGLLTDDCITISMDVVVFKPAHSIQIPQTMVLTAGKAYQDFANRLLTWFTAQQQRPSPDLDFTLQSSDGKEFFTCRWILMAHSAVFAAMLKEGSVEHKESRCVMADIDGETTEIMLNYLYGCSMHRINMGNVEKVLIMADKYELMGLLHACEELLANNVTVDTAVHLLIVASQRGLAQLAAAAVDVLPKNLATALKNVTPEDFRYLEADPELMQTIMEHCVEKCV